MLLADILIDNGFTILDFGMSLPYKLEFGAKE